MTIEDVEHNCIQITRSLCIPLSELQFQFSRSSGPGGQNVNKRETRVELLFDVLHSPSLNAEQRERLLQRLSSQIDKQGCVRVVAEAQRSQFQNRQDALLRFAHLIRQGLHAPKRRHPTRPSRQTVERRLSRKRRHSQLKESRRDTPQATE